MKKFFIFISLASFFFMWFSPVQSAEITRTPTGILIEGEIERGDYEKVEQILRSKGPSWGKLYLASPGGDLVEAMKIGKLARKLFLAVNAPGWLFKKKLENPTNAVCASACFFIYAGAVLRSGTKIGIHRPTLTSNQLKQLTLQSAAKKSIGIRHFVESYLSELGVPRSYADRMFSIPASEVEWINRADLERDFNGFDPSVDEWLEAQCNNLTSLEKELRHTLNGKSWENSIGKEEAEFLKTLDEKLLNFHRCKARHLNKASTRKWIDAYMSGNAEAQYQLARMIDLGDGVIGDNAQASLWYLKAATKGHVEAQNMAGNMYSEEGLLDYGVIKDDQIAVKWYMKAVAQGDANAHAALAGFYAKGRVVKENLKRAAELYEKAFEIEEKNPPEKDPESKYNITLRGLYGDRLAEVEKALKQGADSR